MKRYGVPRLVVVQGPSSGAKLVLTRSRANVGRQSTNDLVLDDSRVSAAHLELERREGGRLLVRDLGSTNGTWLGTHRIIEAEIGPGALLRVGESTIQVDIDERAEPVKGSQQARFGGSVPKPVPVCERMSPLEVPPHHRPCRAATVALLRDRLCEIADTLGPDDLAALTAFAELSLARSRGETH